MRVSKFSDQMIADILRELTKSNLETICQKYHISRATVYKWKAKYDRLSTDDIHQLNILEQKYRSLEEAYRKICLENKILHETIAEKL